MMDTGRMTEYKEKGIYKGHGGRQEGGQHTHRYCEGRKEGRHIKNMEGRKEDNTHTQDTIREGKEGLRGKHGRQEGGQHTYEILSEKERRKTHGKHGSQEGRQHTRTCCKERKEGRHTWETWKKDKYIQRKTEKKKDRHVEYREEVRPKSKNEETKKNNLSVFIHFSSLDCVRYKM